MPSTSFDPGSAELLVAELRRSEQRYRLLASLGRIINTTLDLEKIFRRAAKELHRLTNCEHISLALAAPDGKLHAGFAAAFAGAMTCSALTDVELAGPGLPEVLRQRRPRLARELKPDQPEEQLLFAQGYRACAWLPLVCRNRGVGVLRLAAREAERIALLDVSLFAELAVVLATAVDNAAAYAEIARLTTQLEQENVYLRNEVETDRGFVGLVGSSPAWLPVRQAIEQVSQTDSTVLITGETGTGKELVARAIHETSLRRRRLLVKVNCAALAPGVIASELFGHEPGAFTGAAGRRIGRFELADRGSIFLDEIGEMPSETQVLLLRVLQERVIERVGSNDPHAVDVRVIAATNRDLEAAVADGRFRSDLFYRLNVFPIRVPPLRERREDVPDLVAHFITLFARRMNRRVGRASERALEILQGYHWPGNVRELENLVERAMIVATGDLLEIDPAWLSGAPGPLADNPMSSLADQERRTILEALARCGGKIYGPDGAAAVLGLRPTTLYGKMRKHAIRKQPGTVRFE